MIKDGNTQQIFTVTQKDLQINPQKNDQKKNPLNCIINKKIRIFIFIISPANANLILNSKFGLVTMLQKTKVTLPPSGRRM